MKRLFPLAIAGIAFCLDACSKNDNNPAPVPDPLSTQAVLKFSGNLSDSTSKITAGAATGTVTYVNDRHGAASSALNFDGSTIVPYSGLQLKGTAFTVSVWIKLDPTNTALYAISGFGTGTGGFGIFTDVGVPGLAISITSTNNARATSAIDNNWHNIAGTYDGTDIKFYLDGVLKATKNHPGTMTDGAKTLTLGLQRCCVVISRRRGVLVIRCCTRRVGRITSVCRDMSKTFGTEDRLQGSECSCVVITGWEIRFSLFVIRLC